MGCSARLWPDPVKHTSAPALLGTRIICPAGQLACELRVASGKRNAHQSIACDVSNLVLQQLDGGKHFVEENMNDSSRDPSPSVSLGDCQKLDSQGLGSLVACFALGRCYGVTTRFWPQVRAGFGN